MVLIRDRYRCKIHGDGCTGDATQVDHIISPAEDGPFFDMKNLRAACRHCNTSRARNPRQPPQTPPHRPAARPRTKPRLVREGQISRRTTWSSMTPALAISLPNPHVFHSLGSAELNDVCRSFETGMAPSETRCETLVDR